MTTDNELKRFRVYMRSKPGMYAQYNGYVDVWATDREDAKRRAPLELKRSSFPDRSASMWIIEKVEEK